jgi:hypothetical protein
MLKTLMRNSFFRTAADWKTLFQEDFSYIIGSRHDGEEIRSFLKELSGVSRDDKKKWKASSLKGLVGGLKKSKATDDALKQNLADLPTISVASVDEVIARLKEMFSEHRVN